MSSVVDAIYQRMQDDTEAVPEDKGESEVVKFYEGLSVLVTGGTDLLGKCLLEKLLRNCPDLKRIYLLVRVKKGEDFQNKCNQLYEDHVFDVLRKSRPNFAEKLTPIRGDLSQDDLGLSEEDRKALVANVEMIFHNGASSKLDEQVSVALKTNILGTKRMLELGRECKKLKGFVFVSTAYSHCPERIVEEKFYRAPADLKTVDDMLQADLAPSGLTKDSLKMLLGEWPNIYTYTKAIAEELVQQHAGRSPFACCVFRPSVVTSCYKEPTPGFCDDKNGPASFFVKIAMGAVHVLYNFDYPIDLVPADLSVNAMLVCAWDSVDRWQIEPEACIYNLGTSQEKPITMRRIKDKVMDEPTALVSSKSRRMPYVVFVTNYLMYFVLRVAVDYVPALVVDVLAILHGYKPEQWSLVRASMGDMCRLMRFTGGNYKVRMPETLKVCDRLNPRDAELFFCDTRRLDWDDYFLTFWRGIRTNVLREKLDGSTDAVETRRCCKCPCKCKCPCVRYGFVFLLGFFAYYLVNYIF